eukprot:TRINITY_DN14543_c0_g1_i2.p1 TRINITY_DN14543_c0_g1~~TRINITY_DN14543_c0_g1_i2.p1  ORF type:complete len:616 (+),score=123.69 TRINITY_DN14543_c0_g1_i2:121-1968(+)
MALGPDPHSYANYNEAIVRDLSVVLRADFAAKTLNGHVDLTVETLKDGVNYVSLDNRGLAVSTVSDLETGKFIQFILPLHHEALGAEVRIPLPAGKQSKGSISKLRVEYSTSRRSDAIQWLEPEQTSGKKYPYFYTQCEAILSRTLLPCQDTPAVKSPYSISVACPSHLVAACSGAQGEVVKGDDGYTTYSYRQPVPIPAYLIAIVCGDIKKAQIGPRSYVWCEQELLEASIHEFSADTENYIQAGEKVTGIPYEWGTYDLVVLPSAFPYGGMENPNLTFLSRSLLAGDRSLTNVVAHEITHSWAGNYVSNASWSDFWLNEGFCVYIERQILGIVKGSEAYRHFEALCGYNDLLKTIADLGATNEYTKLRPNLTGVDPDEAFSKIPYEKGSLFLLYLETVVGGNDAMRAWLNAYYTKYMGKSATSEDFKAHFINWFTEVKPAPAGALAKVDWATWLDAPGLPAFNPHDVLDRSLVVACEALAKSWREQGRAGASATDLAPFQAKQTMYFLDQLLTTAVPMAHDRLLALDELYGFSTSKNVEIGFRYLMLAIKSGYRAALPTAQYFLSQHGRGLYVKPMYVALDTLDHAYAVETWKKNRSFYHAVIKAAFDGKLSK